jgi:hypothetical protein
MKFFQPAWKHCGKLFFSTDWNPYHSTGFSVHLKEQLSDHLKSPWKAHLYTSHLTGLEVSYFRYEKREMQRHERPGIERSFHPQWKDTSWYWFDESLSSLKRWAPRRMDPSIFLSGWASSRKSNFFLCRATSELKCVYCSFDFMGDIAWVCRP